MDGRLKGKVAVVTGSGQGIGKGIAIGMAKEGAKVVTNNRRPGSTGLVSHDVAFLRTLTTREKEQAARVVQDAETTAKEIRALGGEAVPFFGDVSDFDAAHNLIKMAIDNFKRIDILVNNAGTFQMAPIWEMSLEAWHRVVDVHLQGTWNCIRHAAGLMKEQKWGRIVNTTSRAWLGMLHHCNYSASKGGIVSLTYALAKDLHPYNITVNSFAPVAMTRSMSSLITRSRRMLEAGTPGVTKEEIEEREATPSVEAMVPFVVYLATEEAANISGTVFLLEGNRIGRYLEPKVISALDKKEGLWTLDELSQQVPKVLLKGYKSRATVSH